MIAETGLNFFQTKCRGSGGDIKQCFEDFKVTEYSDLERFDLLEEGKYGLYSFEARGWETFKLIRVCAQKLNIPVEQIRICGLKDKHAVTHQLLQIKSSKIYDLRETDFCLKHLGFTNHLLQRGDHDRNLFEIQIRGASFDSTTDCLQELNARGGCLNLFGLQRFGYHSTNQIIGKLLTENNHVEALEMFYEQHPDKQHLRMIPYELQELYLNSFLSSLFNQRLQRLHSNEINPLKAQQYLLVALADVHGNIIQGSEFQLEKEELERAQILLDHEVLFPVLNFNLFGLGLRSSIEEEPFYTLPQLDAMDYNQRRFKKVLPISKKPFYRSIVQSLRDVRSSLLNDILHLSFSLGTGQYATIFLREITK